MIVSGTEYEVERVYLLDRMPDLPADHERLQIDQGYLIPPPGSIPGESPEGRVRSTRFHDGSHAFSHTIKKGMGLVREEQERVISREEFERLWPLTRGRRVSKSRTRVPVGELIWELDDFQGFDLVLAEVEIPDPDFAFDPPEWLQPRILREVTEDPAYRNYELARHLRGGDPDSDPHGR